MKVFDKSGVTEEVLSILVNMSVLPAVYISMEWIREWLELKDNNPVVSLVEKGWLKRDEEARLYLHPLMQDVVRAVIIVVRENFFQEAIRKDKGQPRIVFFI